MSQPLRFLHTSDWHLGQHFMGKSRAREHEAFFAWLFAAIAEHQVDAVIVAGDVFDIGTPPSYARKLYNDVVQRMIDAQCQFVVLGGNHDSVAMLAESQSLFKRLNVHVVPAITDNPAELVLPLRKRSGNVGALLCGLPFIRPRDVVALRAGMQGDAVEAELQQQIQQYYAQVYAAAEQYAEQEGLQVPIIGTGHLTTFGASLSESVRDIYVGTLRSFPSDAFPPFAYLALGHIHRPQQVGKQVHFRYSGSPIALSFDEANTQKEVMLVECTPEEAVALTPLPVPQFQAMQVLKGNLASLEEQLDGLVLPSDGSTLWLELQVHEDGYLTDLPQRLERILHGKAIEVLRIMRAQEGPSAQLERQAHETLAELTPSEVFARRLALETLTNEEAEQLTAMHDSILASVLEEGAE